MLVLGNGLDRPARKDPWALNSPEREQTTICLTAEVGANPTSAKEEANILPPVLRPVSYIHIE